jgi:hypothetical protein
MSGASRKEPRSGRYASRSIAQFHKPVSAIAPTSTMTNASGSDPKCKIWVKIMNMIKAIKADSMNTSP